MITAILCLIVAIAAFFGSFWLNDLVFKFGHSRWWGFPAFMLTGVFGLVCFVVMIFAINNLCSALVR